MPSARGGKRKGKSVAGARGEKGKGKPVAGAAGEKGPESGGSEASTPQIPQFVQRMTVAQLMGHMIKTSQICVSS